MRTCCGILYTPLRGSHWGSPSFRRGRPFCSLGSAWSTKRGLGRYNALPYLHSPSDFGIPVSGKRDSRLDRDACRGFVWAFAFARNESAGNILSERLSLPCSKQQWLSHPAPKAPFDVSVFSAAAASLLLSTQSPDQFTWDARITSNARLQYRSVKPTG